MRLTKQSPEPIDARALFYFITRMEQNSPSFPG